MRPSRGPAPGSIGRHHRGVAVTGLCAIILAVAANTCAVSFSATDSPGYEPVEYSLWKRLIRRLKPADPESTEIMLADRGLDYLDQSKALS